MEGGRTLGNTEGRVDGVEDCQMWCLVGSKYEGRLPSSLTLGGTTMAALKLSGMVEERDTEPTALSRWAHSRPNQLTEMEEQASPDIDLYSSFILLIRDCTR